MVAATLALRSEAVGVHLPPQVHVQSHRNPTPVGGMSLDPVSDRMVEGVRMEKESVRSYELRWLCTDALGLPPIGLGAALCVTSHFLQTHDIKGPRLGGAPFVLRNPISHPLHREFRPEITTGAGFWTKPPSNPPSVGSVQPIVKEPGFPCEPGAFPLRRPRFGFTGPSHAIQPWRIRPRNSSSRGCSGHRRTDRW